MQKISSCLWFDTQAEEAAKFYVSVFENSRILNISHYGENMPMPAGTVLTVDFELDGVRFMALNGGPQFKFTEAVSFVVSCKSQEEIDELWRKLTAGGSEVQCGWLKDRYGLSWQIVPEAMEDWLKSDDDAGKQRMLQAIEGMVKLDIAALKRAFDGKA